MNTELKARYFAQYIGLSVLRHIEMTSHNLSKCLTSDMIFCDNTWYLLLRDISSLTDEEAIQVAKILGCVKPSFERYVNYFLIRDDDDQPYPMGRSGFTFKLWYYDISLELVINGRIGQITNQLAVFEYLKSIGIALPCFDHETNQLIPVSELVNKGWVKLKE